MEILHNTGTKLVLDTQVKFQNTTHYIYIYIYNITIRLWADCEQSEMILCN